MNLIPYKKIISEFIGLVDYELSDHQFTLIIRELSSLPQNKRSVEAIRSIVTRVTGVKDFLIVESSDTSDIDHIIDQIIEIIKSRGK